jgi:hypothetical protein
VTGRTPVRFEPPVQSANDEDDEPDRGSEPSWDEAWVSAVLILIGAAALVVAVCLVR